MRWLAYACLAALVAAVAALPIAPLLIDWSRYRPEIAQAASQWLGRGIEVKGGVTVELLPRAVVTLSGVSLGGDGGGPPVAARLVRLHPLVSSLIVGRLEIQSLTLVEPAVELRALSGAGWFAWPAGLAEIAIENGRVLAAGGSPPVAERLSGSLSVTSPSGTLDVALAGSAGEAPLSLRASIARSETNLSGLALSIAAAGGTARFTGSFDRNDSPAVSGRVSVQAEDAGRFLGPLIRLWGRDPRLAPAGALSLSAQLKADMGTLELTGVQAEIAGVDIDGRIRAGWGPSPSLDAALRIPRLELAPLLDAWRQFTRAGPFALPRELAGSLDLRLDSVTWRGGLVRQAQLTAQLAGGEAVLKQVSAQLPGGTELSAFGTLIARADQPRLDLDLDVSSDNLRLVVGWLGWDLTGAAPARLRRATLGGRLSLTPEQLDLAGIDLRIDSTRLRGGLTLVIADPPAFGLRLALDRLNLDAYRADTGQSSLAWLASLPHFDANLSLSADLLTVDGSSLRDLAVEATVRDGKVTLDSARVADLAGARLAVSGTLSPSAAGPAADLGFELAASDPGQLLRLSGAGQRIAPDRLGPIKATGHLAGPVGRLALEAKLGARGRTAPVAGTVAVAALGAAPGPSIALQPASLDAIAALASE
jgi:hypothetical protein